MPNMLKKSKLGFWPNPTCGHIVHCEQRYVIIDQLSVVMVSMLELVSELYFV